MLDLPSGIVIESLPGPTRGKSPAIYYRDEVVWNPSKTVFALAYTIIEASMMNEIGCVLWGKHHGTSAKILGNPQRVYACCWTTPWCQWIDDHTFAFKCYRYDGKRLHLPIVIINVYDGYSIVPNTNNEDSRPFDLDGKRCFFKVLDNKAFIEDIENAT